MDLLDKISTLNNEQFNKLRVKLKKQGINLDARVQELTDIKINRIEPAPKLDLYPLSYAQKRLYHQQSLSPQSLVFNLPSVYKLSGTVSTIKLKNAFNSIIARHESLRTRFVLKENEPMMEIQEFVNYHIVEEEIREAELKTELEKFITVFDLNECPLLRLKVLKTEKQEHFLLFDIHHIVVDGYSMGILIKELAQAYSSLELPSLQISYKDYAFYQSQEYTQSFYKANMTFWEEYLKGFSPKCLTENNDFADHKPYEGDRISFEIDSNISSQLYQLARENSTTLYNVLVAIIQLFLAKLTSTEDITLGTVFSGRNKPGLDKLIGMFANTLPIRTRLIKNKTFVELLKYVIASIDECTEHQNYNHNELLNSLKVPRNIGANPFFDVAFLLQNMGNLSPDLEGIRFSPVNFNFNKAEFTLEIQCVEEDGKLNFLFEYNLSIINKETIKVYVRYFKALISKIYEKKDTIISDIDIASDSQICKTDQGNKVHQNLNLCIDFVQHTIKNPDTVALIEGDNQYTFGTIYNRVNDLYFTLSVQWIQNNYCIGIHVDTIFDSVVVLLCSMLMGCKVTVLNSLIEQTKNEDYIHQLNLCCIIVNKRTKGFFRDSTKTLDLNSVPEAIQQKSIDNSNELQFELRVPKCFSASVQVSVFNCHTFYNNVSYYRRTMSGLSGSHYLLDDIEGGNFVDIIGNFLYSKNTLIAQNKIKRGGYAQLSDFINRYRLRYLILSFNDLIGLCSASKSIHEGIEYIFIDELYSAEATQKICKKSFPAAQLIKLLFHEQLIIGNSIQPESSQTNHRDKLYQLSDNCRPVILNHDNKSQPNFVAGILAVYMQNDYRLLENKTDVGLSIEEEDVSGPISSKVIKTNIFAKRVDSNKVYAFKEINGGFRFNFIPFCVKEYIDLVKKFINVNDALICTRLIQNKNCRVLYLVTSEDYTTDSVEARLKKHFPTKYIPDYILKVSEIPTYENGEVNFSLLPLPTSNYSDNNGTHITSSITYKSLERILKQVLGVSIVNKEDNFFSLGGDSIKAIQVIAKLKQDNLSLKLEDIFEYPTIQLLAENVTSKTTYIDQGIVEGVIPLVPIQTRFFSSDYPDKHHFNQSLLLKVNCHFSLNDVQRVFNHIVLHHDFLRATYKSGYDGIVQYNRNENATLRVNEYDLSDDPVPIRRLEYIAQQEQAGFKLESGMLINVVVFRLNDQESRLLIIAHHLIIDGVSWRILLEDIKILFKQVNENISLSLPQKTTSFKDWSIACRNYAKSDGLKSEKDYWVEADTQSFNTIPCDFKTKDFRKIDYDIIYGELNKDVTKFLKRDFHNLYNTDINDILLLGLSMGVEKTFSISKVSVFVEGHGRERIADDIDITRTIGWFTSIYPVLLDISGQKNLVGKIKKVKNDIRNIPNKGIGYGILRYINKSLPTSELEGKNCVNDIVFNYFGALANDINNDVFTSAIESSGKPYTNRGNEEFKLQVTILEENESFRIIIKYNKKAFKENTVKRLVDNYLYGLRDLAALYEDKTNSSLIPSDLTYNELSYEQLEKLTELYKIEDIYRLSPMQQGILVHMLSDPDPLLYYSQFSNHIEGDFDPSIARRALEIVYQQNDALRTVFVTDCNGLPLQVVCRTEEFPIRFLEVTNYNDSEKVKIVKSEKAYEIEKGREVDKSMPIRFLILKHSTQKYEIVSSFSHLLFDALSISIMMKEFYYNYDCIKTNKTIEPPRKSQFKEYIKWIYSQPIDSAIVFWKEYLNGFTKVPTIFDVKQHQTVVGNRVAKMFSTTLTMREQIDRLVIETGNTFDHFIIMIWSILVSKLSGLNDVTFGVVSNGRSHELENSFSVMGLFVNTLPFRFTFNSGTTVRDALKQVRNNIIKMQRYSYLSINEIQKHTGIKEDLLGIILNVGPKIKPKTKLNREFKLNDTEGFEYTSYDFVVDFYIEESLIVKYTFIESKYSEVEVELIHNYLITIIEQLLQSTEISISGIAVENTIKDCDNDTSSLEADGLTVDFTF